MVFDCIRSAPGAVATPLWLPPQQHVFMSVALTLHCKNLHKVALSHCCFRHFSATDSCMNLSCAAGDRRHMPEEVYIALETLLPTGKGQFLELWAAPDAPREGWTQVVNVPPG